MANRFTLPSAVHLFLLREDCVLLLRRFNTGYEDGSYSVVAGHLNGGETIIEAAAREAREEVGVTINPDTLEVVGVMHRCSEGERIDWFLTARTWQDELHNCEPHRCDELRWSSLNSLPPNIIPYVRHALDNMQAKRWFDSFGWEREP